MADIKTRKDRSRNMAAIRSKDTKPELYIRKLLYKQGFRYRLQSKTVPGHPDLYLAKYNTAVFIHGCFWHRHKGCKLAYMPKSNTASWAEKFSRNIQRDLNVQEQLAKRQIKCLIIWECSIRKMMVSDEVKDEKLHEIREFFLSVDQSLEL